MEVNPKSETSGQVEHCKEELKVQELSGERTQSEERSP